MSRLINSAMAAVLAELSDAAVATTAGELIAFEAEGRQLEFTERVRAFTLEDFREMFDKAGLSLQASFGDYQLGPFMPEESDRIIVIAQKG